ncbi:MAG: NAD(P)/FAD-dependent oxidoreductase [Oscillospiraceae bacterium]|nr:NAD(P)/FAD-dependent oxidoreductase [Oscillospiraceae bacterium]
MYDILIIGCGVTGAAAAYELSRYQLRIGVLEAANDVAMGCSKANSAIIHAGYDPAPGSLMAKLNVEGCAMAEELCAKLDVPYAKIGSMVVAFTEADEAHIQKLYERGVANGVPELAIIDGDAARALEPNLAEGVRAALLAPSAGVISPWEYTLAMAEVAVKNGAELHLGTKVTAIEKTENGFAVTAADGRVFNTRYIINAAGEHADTVHELVGEKEFTVNPTRGEYYLLDKSEGTRVGRTIFQCPNELGKGVLVSPTVHGNLIVGPNAEPGSGHDNTATTAQGLAFVKKMAALSVPSVNFRENIRNFAGVRPNTEFDAFCIGESKTAKGMLNLAGIKSPGLTAAPAIAKHAVKLLAEMGVSLTEKENYEDGREVVRFKHLSDEEKAAVIAKDARFGRVICRCETITEGEIVAALHSPIPARSINGVKRRAGSGMGRCQGGFCAPRVAAIIARELGIPQTDVLMEDEGSYVLTGKLKEEV